MNHINHVAIEGVLVDNSAVNGGGVSFTMMSERGTSGQQARVPVYAPFEALDGHVPLAGETVLVEGYIEYATILRVRAEKVMFDLGETPELPK